MAWPLNGKVEIEFSEVSEDAHELDLDPYRVLHGTCHFHAKS